MEEAILGYIREHWPSEVREEWQVSRGDYPGIVEKILGDFTQRASKKRRFFRIAGQSGSGKTTQLLPAARASFGDGNPVLVAARRFVEYHPYGKEIEREYGTENLRRKTDDVSTVLMFLTLRGLIRGGYDIILDVSLLDPLVEEMLMGMLEGERYRVGMSMVVASREISEGFIRKRLGRVVAEETTDEFWRTSEASMGFYAEKFPKLPAVLWSAWGLGPIYDGEIGGCLDEWRKNLAIKELPEGMPSEEELREAKVEYLTDWGKKNFRGKI